MVVDCFSVDWLLNPLDIKILQSKPNVFFIIRLHVICFDLSEITSKDWEYRASLLEAYLQSESKHEDDDCHHTKLDHGNGIPQFNGCCYSVSASYLLYSL